MNSLATLFRSTVLRSSINDFRAFHSTPIVAKTVTEKVTDVADKVNKKVGKRLASAIEKGEQVTQSAKESMGVASGKVEHNAEEISHATEQASKAAGDQVKHASNKAGQKINQAGSRIRENLEELPK